MPPEPSVAPAHASATIVLIRDIAQELEVLLVRRSSKLTFHGGAWVFPGGRVDPSDRDRARPDDVLEAARRAAVRELREEASLDIELQQLVPISRWITPEILPKRFDTWFFIAEPRRFDVVVDGGEIREFRWITPSAALQQHNAGEIELPPPTFVTLTDLAVHNSVAEALSAAAAVPPPSYAPRICNIEGGACSLYEGDAGYESLDPDKPGARHRLWLLKSGWRYERD